jgi:hypothetical protein
MQTDRPDERPKGTQLASGRTEPNERPNGTRREAPSRRVTPTESPSRRVAPAAESPAGGSGGWGAAAGVPIVSRWGWGSIKAGGSGAIAVVPMISRWGWGSIKATAWRWRVKDNRRWRVADLIGVSAVGVSLKIHQGGSSSFCGRLRCFPLGDVQVGLRIRQG